MQTFHLPSFFLTTTGLEIKYGNLSPLIAHTFTLDLLFTAYAFSGEDLLGSYFMGM